MIGAVRQDGSTACMTVEGAVNAEIFRSYVREVLLPTMRAGDILVMDNLITDKDQDALRAFFSTSVMLFTESPKKKRTIDRFISYFIKFWRDIFWGKKEPSGAIASIGYNVARAERDELSSPPS